MRCGKSAGALQTDGRAVADRRHAFSISSGRWIFGAFEGHNCEELKADVRIYQAWIDGNGTLPFPQGESRRTVQRRCVEGFCELLKEVWTREKLPASLALIVHGGTIMALLDAFAEGSYYDYQCANAKGYKGRLSVEFNAAGNTLRDTIKIADVRKLEE